MKQILLKTAKGLLVILLIAAAFVIIRLGAAHLQVARATIPDIAINENELGSTASLTILPLYEEAAVSQDYQSGHGVSYLLRTDESTILMDLGANLDQSNPPPMLANMRQANISPAEIDLLFISHNHPDHIGGLRWRPDTFVMEDGQSPLDVQAAYVPLEMAFDNSQGHLAKTPQVIAPGVASLGRMPFVQPFPFSLWQPLGYEQVLAINVSGHGIVLITGCGHPTLEGIVAQAESIFPEPVVGIVGGLHYEGLSREELESHIQFLAGRNPQLVALSPHDDSPDAINAFQNAFPEAYRTIQVGDEIHFGPAAAAGTSSQ